MQVTKEMIFDCWLQLPKYEDAINEIYWNILDGKEPQFEGYLQANWFKDLSEFKELFWDDPYAREIAVFEYLLTRKGYTY